MTDPAPTPEDAIDLAAAEHVLGLLDGAEAADAKRRIAADPAFAARVAAWEARLAPLLDGPDAQPPAALWERIRAAAPANDVPRIAPWRPIALGAIAAAAALLLALLLRPAALPQVPVAPPAAQPVIVATLAGEAQGRAMSVSYDRAAARLTVNPVGVDLGDRVPELWIIPADGKARSLGVVRADAPSRVAVAAGHRAFVTPGSTLAITVEPPGGSPTGQATGPIILSGKIVII